MVSGWAESCQNTNLGFATHQFPTAKITLLDQTGQFGVAVTKLTPKELGLRDGFMTNLSGVK